MASWIPSATWTPVPGSLCSCSEFQEVVARCNIEKSSWFQLPIFDELGLNIQGRKDARKERKDERPDRKVFPTCIMFSISLLSGLKRDPAIRGRAAPSESPDTAIASRIAFVCAFLCKLCVPTLGAPSCSAAGAGANSALHIGRWDADVAVAGLAFVCAFLGKLFVHTLAALPAVPPAPPRTPTSISNNPLAPSPFVSPATPVQVVSISRLCAENELIICVCRARLGQHLSRIADPTPLLIRSYQRPVHRRRRDLNNRLRPLRHTHFFIY